jgi:hypothetical protein
MKLLKNLLAVITLCSISSLDARVVGTAATPPQSTVSTPSNQQSVPLPEIPTSQQNKKLPVIPTSYTAVLAHIKAMPPHQVLRDDMLIQSFRDMINNNNNLSDTEKNALLQAGITRHAQWFGNDQQDKQRLINIIQRNQQGQQSKQLPQIPQQQITPIFYNNQTAMLNEKYLQDQVTMLIGQYGSNSKKIIDILTQELRPQMLKIWTDKNISNKATLTTILLEQITDAVTTAQEERSQQPGQRILNTVRPNL